MKHYFLQAKRLVVKVGSALLVDQQQGVIHRQWLESLCEDVALLRKQGKQVILVSSGSIAIGKRHLGLMKQKLLLEEKQAAAATGQIRLAHAYQEVLSKHDLTVAQILLTLDDSENRKRYLNAKNTLETLLRYGVIPIINENDTVATSEIRYGDNDRLSARVAQMVSADTLVLLSDIDGLYTANPRIDANAQFVEKVSTLTPELMAMGGDSGTAFGSGGMKTKLAAAQIVMASGCRMVICSGHQLHPLQQLMQDEPRCTWFLPDITPKRARKNWLAQHLQTKGHLVIDEGALQALKNGKSLLSAGVVGVEGDFQKGDPVKIISLTKQEVGRGLCNYAAFEARLIMGKKSQKIESILGYRSSDEMIHRDDMVLV